MKRTIEARVELVIFVELEIQDHEQVTADPEGEISDGEAAEMAINTAIRNCDVFVFGPDYAPAQVHIDSTDIEIQGECDDE